MVERGDGRGIGGGLALRIQPARVQRHIVYQHAVEIEKNDLHAIYFATKHRPYSESSINMCARKSICCCESHSRRRKTRMESGIAAQFSSNSPLSETLS